MKAPRKIPSKTSSKKCSAQVSKLQASHHSAFKRCTACCFGWLQGAIPRSVETLGAWGKSRAKTTEESSNGWNGPNGCGSKRTRGPEKPQKVLDGFVFLSFPCFILFPIVFATFWSSTRSCNHWPLELKAAESLPRKCPTSAAQETRRLSSTARPFNRKRDREWEGKWWNIGGPFEPTWIVCGTYLLAISFGDSQATVLSACFCTWQFSWRYLFVVAHLSIWCWCCFSAVKTMHETCRSKAVQLFQ